MKIIADASIRKALERILDEGHLTGAASANHGALVAYANTIEGDSADRSSIKGLRILDDFLSDPKQQIQALLIISFESLEALLSRADQCPAAGLLEPDVGVAFLQLPASQGDLKRLSRSDEASKIWRARDWKGWLLRLEASERLFKKDSAEYRHGHKNLIAAVRIFLGALQAGHIDDSQAKDILVKFIELEVRLGGEVAITSDADHIIRQCRHHRELFEKVKGAKPPRSSDADAIWSSKLRWFEERFITPQSEPIIPSGFKILMLDDQAETGGWRYVLDALAAESGAITYALDWEAAKTALADTRFDLMLLDCNLGNEQPTGLELLGPLRYMRAGLPVVMMTAYDNAELALWALRAGCNNFYAKELEDREDRDSFNYYKRFAQLLALEDWTWQRELRDLWKSFHQNLPLPLTWQDAEAHLRYAFYQLFSLADNTVWWARGATHVIDKPESLKDWVCRTAVLSIIAADRIKLTTSAAQDVARRARHPGRVISGRNALCVLKDALGSIPKTKESTRGRSSTPPVAISPEFPKGCRLSRDMLTEDECRANGPDEVAPISLSHLERSRLGALQFALGHIQTARSLTATYEGLIGPLPQDVDRTLDELEQRYKEEVKPIALPVDARIILIDDEGNVNGWQRTLKMVLGDRVEWYNSVDSCIRALSPIKDKKCVVLLDLWLLDEETGKPSPEAGIKALQLLKKEDFGLPVIVLSAATDTIHAIRCIKLGALDYVPKWLSRNEGNGAWATFTSLFLNRLIAASKLSEVGPRTLRGLWQALFRITIAPSPLDSFPLLLERIDKWPSGGGTSHSERLLDLRREFYGLLLPAVVLYHSNYVSLVTNGEIPPFDAWRVKHVLQSRTAVDDDIALFAGRAVEYLGQMRCAIENPEIFVLSKYRKGDLGYFTTWIDRASGIGKSAWDVRNLVKDKVALQAQIPSALDVLLKAIEAIGEFEQRATRDAAWILKK